MKRMKIGEIAEVRTQAGLAYTHYCLRHSAKPVMGDLHRVLPGLYKSRPGDLVALAYEPHRFVTFCPLSQGFAGKTVQVIGYAEPTKEQSTMPTFRQLQLLCDDRRPRWSLWNGQEDVVVAELTKEQRGFPRGPSTVNVLALIDSILFHNGVITPERKEFLDKRREVLAPMAAAFAKDGDFQSAANLYIELLDTDPKNKSLLQALKAATQGRT
jgi:hypothetical protein